MKRNDIIEDISSILVGINALKFSDAYVLQQAFQNREDITFEEFLLEQGIVNKMELLQALSLYYGVPPLDVVGEFFDHYLLRLFPKDVMLEYMFIPYQRHEDILTVVAAEPNNPDLPVVLGDYIYHDINFMVGLPQDILDTIEEFYDESDTYQPHQIANQRMERSQVDAHPMGEELRPTYQEADIPLAIEETDDDYDSH